MKPFAWLLVLSAILVAGGCTSSRDQGGQSQLDGAISLYIEGDYESAEARLLELTQQLTTDDELQTAYLYLGRTYLATEEYVRAAEAFSSGKMLGGGARFEAYLTEAQMHLRSEPHTIRNESSVTRGQIAALLHRLFGPSGAMGRAMSAEVGGHWADEYIRDVRAAGFMDALPDGDFHADSRVTRPAFYIIVQRITGVRGLSSAAVDPLFPAGFRSAVLGVASQGDEQGGFVSGGEATRILEELALESRLESDFEE